MFCSYTISTSVYIPVCVNTLKILTLLATITFSRNPFRWMPNSEKECFL